MNHDVLKAVIFDQHEVIRNADIVPRPYEFDPQANYVLTGLRRAGKSTMLYQMVRDLVAKGVDWRRIVYVNFEDERLVGMTAVDLGDIVAVQAELSGERGFYFLDEPQVVDGWERFVRRLVDAGERVQVTGSNARMLSSEVASTLGGRLIERHVDTYSFDEYLTARGIPHHEEDLYATQRLGRVRAALDDYLRGGGLPEALRYAVPRKYVESVYQKVLLGDIVTRHGLRQPQALRLLMRKVAETVMNEVSATRLRNDLKEVGLSTSIDSVIDYLAYVEEAFLVMRVTNAYARFAEREGAPKYYFTDNGLLSLHLVDRDSALLENVVACHLARSYGDGVHFVRSARTGIDVDFYVPEEGLAVQVAYRLSDSSHEREVANLVRLARAQPTDRLVVVTMSEDGEIERDGCAIGVVSAPRFLLSWG